MNQNSEITLSYNQTFPTVLSATNKMVDFIKPTYGPAGNKVIIRKFAYRMVVDDGVQAARDFELSDPSEQSVVELIREVPIRTSDRAKDSTTGSLIMLQAIINEVDKTGNWNGRSVSLELEAGLKESSEALRKMARPIKTKADIRKVALISYDNPLVADMMADLYDKLGPDGKITVDRSPTMDITSEIAEGITIDKGYISPYMITNASRMETVFEKPYILITDYRLTEANDILPVLNLMAGKGYQNLVIIAENVEQHALATMVVNLPHIMNPQTGKPGVLHSVAITAPSGEHRKVTLEDIALMVGGKVFTESKGDKLENAKIEDLGRAERIIVRREESVIVGPKGKKADIAMAITELRASIDAEKEPRKKQELEDRLVRFTGKVAVIKVGAPTENDQKAIKYKVENAVNAVKNALKGGVVPGGGAALASIETSSEIFNQVLKAPRKELLVNMGIRNTHMELKDGEAFNVITGEKGDMFKVGVMDPVESLIAGLESAVSIAGLLVTSKRMIVEHAKAESKS